MGIAADSPEARFLPGAVVAGRYRVFGLLGRGGMGEVYRADDLKLGQPVALKFLPAELAADAGRRDRLLREVTLARQVAHPNVCRVYDVGEVKGQHFLSMEYVDGEDLASLLRRIGRLPPESPHEGRQRSHRPSEGSYPTSLSGDSPPDEIGLHQDSREKKTIRHINEGVHRQPSQMLQLEHSRIG